MEGKDLKWIYETVLSGPGMDETVKLNFTASRKMVLLLSEVIEKGITIKGTGLMDSVDNQLISELQELRKEFIEKSKLSKLCEQLNQL